MPIFWTSSMTIPSSQKERKMERRLSTTPPKHPKPPLHTLGKSNSDKKGKLLVPSPKFNLEQKPGTYTKLGKKLGYPVGTTAEVWGNIRAWLGLRRAMSTLPMTLKWMKIQAMGSSWICKAKRMALAATVYWIWKCRNPRIFEDVHIPMAKCVRKIKTLVYKNLFDSYKLVFLPNTQLKTCNILEIAHPSEVAHVESTGAVLEGVASLGCVVVSSKILWRELLYWEDMLKG